MFTISRAYANLLKPFNRHDTGTNPKRTNYTHAQMSVELKWLFVRCARIYLWIEYIGFGLWWKLWMRIACRSKQLLYYRFSRLAEIEKRTVYHKQCATLYVHCSPPTHVSIDMNSFVIRPAIKHPKIEFIKWFSFQTFFLFFLFYYSQYFALHLIIQKGNHQIRLNRTSNIILV